MYEFHVFENPNGDVDINFDEPVPSEIYSYLSEKLKKEILGLGKNERTVYNLNKIVSCLLWDLEQKIIKEKGKKDVSKILSE